MRKSLVCAESSGGREAHSDGILAEWLPDAEEDAATMAGSARPSDVHRWKTLQKPGSLTSVALDYFG